MNILYVFSDKQENWNCGQWTLSFPLKAINATGKHTAKMVSLQAFNENSGLAMQFCEQAEIIVVQRNFFEGVLARMQYWKDRGKVLIASFDDAYQYTHPSNISYKFWKQDTLTIIQNGVSSEHVMAPSALEQFKTGLGIVHAATVPSRTLCVDWSGYTDMYYLPNYIDTSLYTNLPETAHYPGIVIIGWGGSVSHLQSFTDSNILTAFKRVCAARPNVRIMIAGDKRIIDQVPVPDKQKIFQDYVPFDMWPLVMANFDIGVVPLAGQYDARRSWIKPLELMLEKIPVIATSSPAYIELEKYIGMVPNTTSGWANALIDRVDNINFYKTAAAGEAYQFAMAQDVCKNVDNILGVYAEIAKKAKGK